MVTIGILSFTVFAQSKTGGAKKVLNASITMDGLLNESVWSNADVLLNKYVIEATSQYIIVGAALGGNSDASTEFVCVWDDVGFYVGSWNKDDIHQAIKCKYLESAYSAYVDDSHEYFIANDFASAYTSSPTQGSQEEVGFNEENGHLYGGIWGGQYLPQGPPTEKFGETNLTMDEWIAYGWDCWVASSDGINFTAENMWTWAGCFMHKIGSKTAGDDVAFDIGLNDNDGTANAADCAMRWSGLTHQTATGYLHWAKITLEGLITVGILPQHNTKNIKTRNSAIGSAISYDILGRRINKSNIADYKGVIFTVNKNNENTKRIVLK